MKKICAVIPAYNVESTIAEVISQVSQLIDPDHIVVINDGSSDRTGIRAENSGVLVLHNRFNQGKGFSVKRGFCHAIENKFDAVITIDGDLQHDPQEIPQFINCYTKTNADLVLGDRTDDLSSMPLDRQFSNKTTSLIISILTRQRVRDSQSGYRLIKTNVIKKIKLASNRYETESELLVKALLTGCKITHVSIKTIYNEQTSHIHRFVDTLRFIWIVFKSLIRH